MADRVPYPRVRVSKWGKLPNGQDVHHFVLRSDNFRADLTDYGASVTHIHAKTKHGELTDVVLGFDSIEGYLKQKNYIGPIVGRVCNRIERGRFTLDGKDYQLSLNHIGKNHMHGGVSGFSHKLWKYEVPDESKPEIIFALTSPDGDENYPGTLNVRVVYSIRDESSLLIDISATTDKPTPVSITNHVYFNLEGVENNTNIYNHDVTIYADKYCPTTAEHVTTGEIESVEGTLFDFREPANIGDRIKKLTDRPGFNNNYCIDNAGTFRRAASLYSCKTGIRLDVSGTAPGVQFYTASYLDEKHGKCDRHYQKHCALSFELQGYPDAVNKAQFPSVIVRPGENYHQQIEYKFSVVG